MPKRQARTATFDSPFGPIGVTFVTSRALYLALADAVDRCCGTPRGPSWGFTTDMLNPTPHIVLPISVNPGTIAHEIEHAAAWLGVPGASDHADERRPEFVGGLMQGIRNFQRDVKRAKRRGRIR